MNTELLAGIDQSIQSHQAVLSLGLSLDRLRANRDFKQVVVDGYLSKEAVRLVHQKAAPGNQSPEIQRQLLAQIDAIGCLHQYLCRIDAEVEISRNSLQSDEQTREFLLSEEN